jgi:hypothetical protein
MIIEEPVQRLSHGGEITPAITSEPPASDQHVDFGLAQLNRDASQPFPSAVPVPGYAVSARRGGGTLGYHVGRACRQPRLVDAKLVDRPAVDLDAETGTGRNLDPTVLLLDRLPKHCHPDWMLGLVKFEEWRDRVKTWRIVREGSDQL